MELIFRIFLLFSLNCDWVRVNHLIFLNKENEVVFLTFFSPETRCQVTQCQEVRFVHKTSWKIRQMEGECSRRGKQREEISAVNSSEF